jgi:two-component system OmpR family response regulator
VKYRHRTPSRSKSDHILIVDIHSETREALVDYLRQQGYRTSVTTSAGAARDLLRNHAIDLAILDILLPGDDCLSLCRYLRAISSMPIILLTTVTEDNGRTLGQECGADDYVIKPVNPRVLLTRIKEALLRAMIPPRPRMPVTGSIHFDNWILDIEQRRLIRRNRIVMPLASSEFLLLHVLLTHAQRTLSREQLLELTQARGNRLLECSINNQISHLRRKLEADPDNPRLIKTVQGGYMFAVAVTICNEPAPLLSNRFG